MWSLLLHSNFYNLCEEKQLCMNQVSNVTMIEYMSEQLKEMNPNTL